MGAGERRIIEVSRLEALWERLGIIFTDRINNIVLHRSQAQKTQTINKLSFIEAPCLSDPATKTWSQLKYFSPSVSNSYSLML